ncbi:GNAT family N-acetyltransferase [Paenibacillus sp. FSL H7-0326]|uniref:GNAT family N-acetyltransferase n=1 Tax=Paenibacillus sp. FSL H7-0326 TaxID=1921144 RepID=UPI00096CCC76|nr:GNAT family N-acetyltransferase [Paenibacillus sp. FSL H7-0326]OMC71710.1 GNAT family N-acetyltransferase [Paenibacillus sp. FSL H7-0326]
MRINQVEYYVNDLHYFIRSAKEEDAKKLSEVRIQIDGETEYLDREQGEGYIDELGFRKLIDNDSKSSNNLFLVVEANEQIVGFSRCEGNILKRFSHKVEFGVCVLKEYWGYGIGKNLLRESIRWAESNGIKKISLNVLEINKKAIELYKHNGFEIEGILKNDKVLSDNKFYSTILMGRINE